MTAETEDRAGYKTAEELGLPDVVYENLFVVRDGLREGKLKHAYPGKTGMTSETCGFNMGVWQSRDKHYCGTVACIGGWTEMFSKLERGAVDVLSRRLAAKRDYGLSRLCFPGGYRDGERDTPEMAAEAIDNYLKTGEPGWYGIRAAHNR